MVTSMAPGGTLSSAPSRTPPCREDLGGYASCRQVPDMSQSGSAMSAATTGTLVWTVLDRQSD